MEDLIINSKQVTDRPITEARFLTLDAEDSTGIDLYEHTLDRLRKGVAVFVFLKKDGTYRRAIGTLNEKTIPAVRSEEAKRYIAPSADKQTFYDLQINEFRSFNVNSIVALIDF